jgi:hypothetical protein
MSGFKRVLSASEPRPDLSRGQNATRHYSETFSREVALWLRDLSIKHQLGANVLLPESKVNTVYGEGNSGKSLNVAALDERGYLIIGYLHKIISL